MKKFLCMALAVMMLLGCVSALAETSRFYYDGAYFTNTFEDGLKAKSLMRIATRSGPGTDYDELGSYHKKGYVLDVLSKAWDENNEIWWLQVELKYGSQYRRVYTGLKRVNVNINAVQEEHLLYTATVRYDAPAFYGPGEKYTQHKSGVGAGMYGYVYGFEDGWALFEFQPEGKDHLRRVWMPVQYLKINPWLQSAM